MNKNAGPACARWALVLLGSLCAHLARAVLPHDAYLTFDGVNDVATLPNSATLSPTAQITVEAWVRPVSIPNNKAQARVISKSGSHELTLSTGDTGCGFGTLGAVQWRATIGGIDARICGGALSLNDWHHIAGTYDGVAFSLYVDGARVASANRSGAIASTSSAILFGNSAANDRPFNGALDEVRIWRRALTQAQLQLNAESTLTGSEADLVAYHRLDESSGQTLLDLTSNANNGVLGASASVESLDPTRVTSAQNSPPVVNAGPDQSIQSPANSVQLQGTVNDDGLPSGTLTHQWSAISGPGTVTFQNANALQTTATFAAPGTYVLQLEANDGALTTTDTLQVQVTSQQSATSLEIKPRFVTLDRTQQQQFTAVARDGAGDPVPATITWSASTGSISSAGLYTPSNAGLITVTASVGSLEKIATVDVLADPVPWPTSGWTIATPSQLDLDANLLAQARDFALQAGGSGMITRNGRSVMTWGSQGARYDVKSTAKSIGTLFVGLAIQDGRVGLHDAAQTHLSTIGVPPTGNINTGWLDNITLLHLGTHTAGFDKPGGYTALLFEPGTAFTYSDGGANWLADVLTNVYATDLNTIGFSRVFTPLGLTPTDLAWRTNAYREDTLNGVKRREFGSGITIDVDAMGRIGYLYLRRGTWQGQRVLPDSFVQQVQEPLPEVVGLPVRDERAGATNHYGYLWWTNADSTLPNVPRDAFWSWGLGESFIIVIPSLDMVITRAGNGWRPNFLADYTVLAPFINPIVDAVNTKISVPNVVGQSSSSAVDAIESARLAIAGTSQQASSTVPAGQVISQSPAAGTPVARNVGVRFVVASEAPGNVVTPEVTGLTQSAAESAIVNAGLVVGAITQQQSASVPAGVVISQNPAAQTVVPQGSSVQLTVSSGAPPSTARLLFDGVNDVATIPHSSLLAAPPQISVEAWITPSSMSATTAQDRVLSKSGSYELTVSTGDTGCNFNTTGNVQWRLRLGTLDQRICGGQLSLNTSHYVVGTYDGATVRLYVNSVLVASAARSGAIASNSNPLHLGNTTQLDRAFDGLIGDVRIWRKALTQTEVQANFTQAPPASAADLLAYYRLNEGSGQVIHDTTPNAAQGTLGKTNSVEPIDPTWVQ